MPAGMPGCLLYWRPYRYFIYRIIIGLCLIFPDHSLVGFSRLLLGRYLGGLLALIYIVSFLFFCVMVTIQFSIIISTSFKPESPPFVWHLVVLVPALYVSYLGISVPARMNELLLPLGLLLLPLVALLNIPNINWDEYLPMLQHGLLPPIEGAVLTAGELTYPMLILALIPLISHKEKLVGYGIPALLLLA
nr:GerAB/ArcD/ProY family transporter [Desulforamulus aquiferis]